MTNMSANVPLPVTWRVTSQSQTTDAAEDGRFTEGVRVSFATSAGDTGSVFLPLPAFTPQAVADAIAARVAVMHQVRGLGAGQG